MAIRIDLLNWQMIIWMGEKLNNIICCCETTLTLTPDQVHNLYYRARVRKKEKLVGYK